MKHWIKTLTGVGVLCVAAAAMAQPAGPDGPPRQGPPGGRPGDDPPPRQAGPEGRSGPRNDRDHRDHRAGPFSFFFEPKSEKGAFLGVVTAPVPEAMTSQLSLPRGIGLLVERVEADSPAAKAGLQQYDILHKLGDQLLVNAHQLAVLVRSHKPGDNVELTVIRQAKPVQVTATLVEKDLPPLAMLAPDGPRPMMPHMMAGGWPHGLGMGASGDRGGSLSGDVVTTIQDQGRSITLSQQDGQRHMKAVDKSGQVLFDGPIETAEQREKVPQDLRRWIATLDRLMRSDAPPPPPPPPPGGGERDGQAPPPPRSQSQSGTQGQNPPPPGQGPGAGQV